MTTVDSPYRTAPFFPRPDGAEREITIPYEGQSRMRLLFAGGISDMFLRVDPHQTVLLRAHFDDIAPTVVATPGEVCLRYRLGVREWLRRFLAGDPVSAAVSLHPAVAWELVVRGGASEVDADLRSGRVTSFDIAGGASDVVLGLPAPQGVVPIRIRGGAADVAIHRPADVPVGLRVSGGVASLEVDEKHVGAACDAFALASDTWAAAPDRYDVRVAGGACDVRVTD